MDQVVMIQRYVRGYRDRNKVVYELLEIRATKLHRHFSRIDKLAKSQFQRRVRRAWFSYKKRKAEKEAREKELAAKKKKKRFVPKR